MLAAVCQRLGVAALCLAAFGVWAQAWTRLPRTEMYGNEYVRIDGWADLYGFKYSRQGDTAITTSRWSRLVFTVNSRQAEINGVAVHLSHPIARRGDDLFISPLDLRTAVQPILYPAPGAQSRVRTVCLDAGHGGKDPGNQEGAHQEKKYTLLLAQELQKQLKAAGFRVVNLRTGDSYIDPNVRPSQVKKLKADVMISLHFNGAGDNSVSGVETYCLTPALASSTNARGEGAGTGAYDANQNDAKNVLLAWQVQKALLKRLDAPDRGVRRARFAVLKGCPIPAILVEGGFMSNPAEMKKIADADYRKKMAQGIVEGLKAYKKAMEAE